MNLTCATRQNDRPGLQDEPWDDFCHEGRRGLGRIVKRTIIHTNAIWGIREH